MPSIAAAQIAAAAQPDANRGDAFMLVALGGADWPEPLPPLVHRTVREFPRLFNLSDDMMHTWTGEIYVLSQLRYPG